MRARTVRQSVPWGTVESAAYGAVANASVVDEDDLEVEHNVHDERRAQ